MFDYGKLNNQNQYNKTLAAIISYIGQTYSQPGNIITSMRNGAYVNIPQVATPTYVSEDDGTEAEKRASKVQNRTANLQYVEGLKERNKKVQTLDRNNEAAYSLVWGQCTASMQA